MADSQAGDTKYLEQQILNRVFDAENNLIRTSTSSGSGSGGDASAANQVTEIARLTSILADTTDIKTSVASIDTKTPALGQALAASSVPVVLTAAQLTTLTPPAAITGFATSAKQDTIIGHVDGIETLLTTLSGAVSGTEMQVDVLTMPVVAVTQSGVWDEVGINDSGNSITVDGTVSVTGVATAANQSTIIGHLDGVEGLLTDIEADTDTLAVVGGGVEASALRVTLANDSTGVLSIDDNGASLTVDNAGLTELAAAINASSQMDTNIAASITLPTSEVAPTTVFNGRTTVTTAGTRVVLAASTTVKSVTIKALAANTGIIYVGNSSVSSSNGYALAAGEVISLDIANLTTVNIDSSVNGEGVTYIAIN